MKTLDIDLETFGTESLKDCGVYRYAQNSEILLCAYAFDDEPVKIIDLIQGERFPNDLADALFDEKVIKCAHNAAFEINILNTYFGAPLDVNQWQCTMVQGLRLGLPAGLEELGKALGLESDKLKLKEGKQLIKYFCTPKPRSKAISLFEENCRNLPRDNVDAWTKFKEYCIRDVESEREIRKRLSKYDTTDFEKKLWVLDQEINGRGVLVDTDLVDGAFQISESLGEELKAEGLLLTGGLNIKSFPKLAEWIGEREGEVPASLDKSAREKLLKGNLTAETRRVLEILEMLSKTSITKYAAMKQTMCTDNRVRGMFQFYGSRTGRWTGRLVQLQNLPQNRLSDELLDAARFFVSRNEDWLLKFFFDNPFDVLSQLIRTAFVARKGSRLIVADFSAIEARIIAWLANEKWRMDVFANGGDIYCASASAMFKVPVEKHGVNKHLRQKGKIAELACGYGGGVDALKAFGADKMGLTDSELNDIIRKWRESSPNIVKLWTTVENAARKALQGNAVTIDKGITFEKVDNFLFVTLPSGRKISYFDAQIDESGSITFKGNYAGSAAVFGEVRTWGGKLVENIVQAIARDCLAVAMTRVGNSGYKIVMHVHDEIVCEMPKGSGSLDEIIQIMSAPVTWAEGLILTADGYETPYYKKE